MNHCNVTKNEESMMGNGRLSVDLFLTTILILVSGEAKNNTPTKQQSIPKKNIFSISLNNFYNLYLITNYFTGLFHISFMI